MIRSLHIHAHTNKHTYTSTYTDNLDGHTKYAVQTKVVCTKNRHSHASMNICRRANPCHSSSKCHALSPSGPLSRLRPRLLQLRALVHPCGLVPSRPHLTLGPKSMPVRCPCPRVVSPIPGASAALSPASRLHCAMPPGHPNPCRRLHHRQHVMPVTPLRWPSIGHHTCACPNAPQLSPCHPDARRCTTTQPAHQ